VTVGILVDRPTTLRTIQFDYGNVVVITHSAAIMIKMKVFGSIFYVNGWTKVPNLIHDLLSRHMSTILSRMS